MLFPRERAREVLRAYRDFIESAPDEVGGGAALLTAPPEPFIPEEVRGKPAMGLVFVYVGPVEDGEQAAASCARRPTRWSTSSSRCPTRRCSRCSTPGTRMASASTSRSTG